MQRPAKLMIADDLGRGFKYLAKYLWKWEKTAEDADELPDWWYYFSRDVFSKRRYGFSNWFRLPVAKRIPGWLRDGLRVSGQLDMCVNATRAAGGGWHLEFHDLGQHGHFAFDIASMYRVIANWAIKSYG